MNIPTFIEQEKILSVNALVTTIRARDRRTDTPAIVLRAPAATAASLAQARATLLTLHALEPPVQGLPTFIAHEGENTGEAVLVLGDLRGEPAQQTLLRLQPLTESQVLQAARQHMALLTALHRAGASGLRPGPADLWLWFTGGDVYATLLGWEWLAPGIGDAMGDVQAASGLWIELATLSPPWPDLAVDRGPALWLALALDIRILLSEVWRGAMTPAADYLGREVTELLDRRQARPEELLLRGKDLLGNDPAAALPWFDLARRATPPPPGVDTAYQSAAAAVGRQAGALIEQGQHDLALGQYNAAERSLNRVSGAWFVDKKSALIAARWQTAAAGLRQAVQADLTTKGMPIRDLERQVIRVTELASGGAIDSARDVLETTMAAVPGGVSLPGLAALQAELRAWQLWARGEAAQAEGRFQDAADAFERVLSEEPRIPYWKQVAAAFGDPMQTYKRARGLAERAAEAGRLADEARQRLENGDASAAAFAARRAAGLSRERPLQQAELTRLAAQATLRMNALDAGVASEAADLARSEWARAVAALFTLKEAFPEDTWVKTQLNRWRQMLLTLLAQEPVGSAGSWLFAGWPQDEMILEGLRKTAPVALKAWEQTLRDVQALVSQGQPARLREAAARLGACRQAMIEGRDWLGAAGQASAASSLSERMAALANQLAERQQQQTTLRAAYESALQRGQAGADVLLQAEQAKVELYDDEERQVARLRTLAAGLGGLPAQGWSGVLRLAEMSWRAGDRESATEGFRRVAAAEEAETGLRTHAGYALTLLDKGTAWRDMASPGMAARGHMRPPENRYRFGVPPTVLVLAAMMLALIGLMLYQIRLMSSYRSTALATGITPTTPDAAATTPVVSPVQTDTATPASTFTPTPWLGAMIGSVTFEPEKIVLPADGESTQQVMILVEDVYGQPAAGRPMSVTLLGPGSVEPADPVFITDARGQATFTYRAGRMTGVARLYVSVGDFSAFLQVELIEPPPATPVTLALDPTAFDVGVGEERTVTVTVRGANDQQPARGVPITIVADPLQSVKVKQPSELTTDEQGEVRATLEFQEVATGELRVSAAGGETVTVTIRVRPSAVNEDNITKNLRAGASETSAGVGDFAAGSRLPIVGQSSDGSWLQVRTGTGSLAWVKRDVVKVEGDVTQVDVVAATPTPTPTNTPTPAPKPTSTKAAATPKPADYPTVGAHQLVVDKSDNLAPMYRVGGTGEGDILLRMPAHGVIVLAQDTKEARPPAGFVLVAATVWVDKSKVSENAGDFSLNNPDENVSACWSVTADKCEGGGLLFKNSQWYSVGKIKPEENGNYAKVTVWVWVKRANIQ